MSQTLSEPLSDASTTTTVVAEQPAPTTAPQTPPQTMMTTNQMIEKYLALRDRVADIRKRHVGELAPYNDAMVMLENILLDKLNAAREESVRTKAGTAYKTTRTSCTVAEWSKTLAYIQDNDAWELLEARVSKTAVEAIMQETQAPVPGVTVRREVALNVRRG